MASGSGPPLSLRPLPVADQKPKNLAEFIARVNSQPGGFRSVTTAQLRDEIRTSQDRNGAAEPEDEDMSDAEDDVDSAAKDPGLARIEVMKNIDLAGNIALLTLDFLSLLLSKQNPTQASLTLSQQLRDMVGIGTLGADKLHDSNATPAKTKDQETVAMGWTLMEVNRTRDSAEEATAFLEREIEAEGRYWEDLMSVRKTGWSLCKVPKERHTLGVRFGFSEAAPEFRNNGLAPMRRGEDGSTHLDLGRLGGVSEALVVTYEKDGKVVGRSTSRRASENPSLESRVLEARNTIFSQELWYELTRESRSLAAYDVKPEGSRLVCNLDATSKITLELLSLESCPESNEGLPENQVAEKTSAALHILLGYAHRCNELMRIRPMPPHHSRSRGQQSYLLLRPIIARMMLLRNIESSTRYIGSLVQTLKNAGLSSSFILRTPQTTPADPNARGPNQLSASHTMVRNMLQTQDFTVGFTILPGISLAIRGRTFSFPVTATYYYIILPPSSPIQSICAPYADGYTDLDALTEYLRTTVARVLTRHCLSILSSSFSNANLIQNIQGTSIRDLDREHLDVRFAIEDEDGSAAPALTVISATLVENEPNSKRWTWTASGQPSEPQTVADVVRATVDQALS